MFLASQSSFSYDDDDDHNVHEDKVEYMVDPLPGRGRSPSIQRIPPLHHNAIVPSSHPSSLLSTTELTDKKNISTIQPPPLRSSSFQSLQHYGTDDHQNISTNNTTMDNKQRNRTSTVPESSHALTNIVGNMNISVPNLSIDMNNGDSAPKKLRSSYSSSVTHTTNNSTMFSQLSSSRTGGPSNHHLQTLRRTTASHPSSNQSTTINHPNTLLPSTSVPPSLFSSILPDQFSSTTAALLSHLGTDTIIPPFSNSHTHPPLSSLVPIPTDNGMRIENNESTVPPNYNVLGPNEKGRNTNGNSVPTQPSGGQTTVVHPEPPKSTVAIPPNAYTIPQTSSLKSESIPHHPTVITNSNQHKRIPENNRVPLNNKGNISKPKLSVPGLLPSSPITANPSQRNDRKPVTNDFTTPEWSIESEFEAAIGNTNGTTSRITGRTNTTTGGKGINQSSNKFVNPKLPQPMVKRLKSVNEFVQDFESIRSSSLLQSQSSAVSQHHNSSLVGHSNSIPGATKGTIVSKLFHNNSGNQETTQGLSIRELGYNVVKRNNSSTGTHHNAGVYGSSGSSPLKVNSNDSMNTSNHGIKPLLNMDQEIIEEDNEPTLSTNVPSKGIRATTTTIHETGQGTKFITSNSSTSRNVLIQAERIAQQQQTVSMETSSSGTNNILILNSGRMPEAAQMLTDFAAGIIDTSSSSSHHPSIGSPHISNNQTATTRKEDLPSFLRSPSDDTSSRPTGVSVSPRTPDREKSTNATTSNNAVVWSSPLSSIDPKSVQGRGKTNKHRINSGSETTSSSLVDQLFRIRRTDAHDQAMFDHYLSSQTIPSTEPFVPKHNPSNGNHYSMTITNNMVQTNWDELSVTPLPSNVPVLPPSINASEPLSSNGPTTTVTVPPSISNLRSRSYIDVQLRQCHQIIGSIPELQKYNTNEKQLSLHSTIVPRRRGLFVYSSTILQLQVPSNWPLHDSIRVHQPIFIAIPWDTMYQIFPTLKQTSNLSSAILPHSLPKETNIRLHYPFDCIRWTRDTERSSLPNWFDNSFASSSSSVPTTEILPDILLLPRLIQQL